MLILSRIHTQQAHTFDPIFKLFDGFNFPNVNAPDRAAANLEVLANHMNEVASREMQLVYFYREAKKVLELE